MSIVILAIIGLFIFIGACFILTKVGEIRNILAPNDWNQSIIAVIALAFLILGVIIWCKCYL